MSIKAGFFGSELWPSCKELAAGKSAAARVSPFSVCYIISYVFAMSLYAWITKSPYEPFAVGVWIWNRNEILSPEDISSNPVIVAISPEIKHCSYSPLASSKPPSI